MPLLQRSGVALYYDDHGSGNPPLLFIHGWSCDHTYFAPQIEHFGAKHRVVAVDLRGHGASEAPVGDYSVPSLADDVAWICDQRDLRELVIVGHSLGALVGIELTARHPELVSGLVMVDGAPIGRTDEGAAFLNSFINEMAGPDPITVRRTFIEQTLFLPTDDPIVKARVLDDMTSVPNHVALETFRGLLGWTGEASMRQLRVPVLAIHASQVLNPPEELAKLCPTVTHVQTSDVGHFTQLLAPADVNHLIEVWLAQFK